MSALGNALTGVRCDIKPDEDGRWSNYHFDLSGCDDCLVRHLKSRPLSYVEERYHAGYVRQAMFEAYMHVWATGAVRFSSLGDGWTDPPTDPEVVALVALFKGERS